jgi:hypothetical protein
MMENKERNWAGDEDLRGSEQREHNEKQRSDDSGGDGADWISKKSGCCRGSEPSKRAICVIHLKEADMTERTSQSFLVKQRARIGSSGTRRLALLMFLAACSMATRASGGTIIVTSTLAVAGSNENALFATFEKSDALSTSKMVADVTAGHLGVLVSVLPGGTAGADAVIILGLTFQDMTADDFLTMNMSLHGTFTPGSGATADFFVDDGNSVTNAATISCNSYNVQFHGVPCFPANSVEAVVPLDNVDSLFLTWQLLPGIGGNSGTADFFNSDDFSITVPNGTVIVNNPGGSLFQTESQTTAAPEPNSGLLLGIGLVFAMLIFRIDWRFRWQIHSLPKPAINPGCGHTENGLSSTE